MKNILLILLVALALPFAANSQAVILKTDTVSISCSSSDTFLVPVRVRNFVGVGAVQFTLTWPTAQLKYAYVTSGSATNPFYLGGATAGFDTSAVFVNSGKLTFTWTKVGGGSFPDDTPIFFVAYRRTGGPYAPVNFSNVPVSIEVADKNGDELPHQLMQGGVLPIDTVPPTITCPLDMTVQSNGPAVVNGVSPTSVADNCTVQQVGWSVSGATTGNFPTDPDASGATFNFGLSTVVYRVTDVGNATATCSFTIMVEPNSTSDTLTIVAGGGNANCGQSIAIPVTALNFDSLGSLQFSMQWDTARLKFDSVSIKGSALTLDAVANFGYAQTTAGFMSFSWTSPTSLVGTTITSGALLFTLYVSPKGGNSGMTQVGFADFPSVREAYTSATNPPEEVPAFYIPGQVNVSDNSAPGITCPANQVIPTQPGELTANATGTAPTLTDNCSGSLTLNYVSTGTTPGTGTGDADGVYNAGATTVTYTAADASGNTATCSFQIIVDAGKPLLLVLDSVETDCSGASLSTFDLNLTVANFQNLIGVQFSMEWDETAISLVSVQNVFPGMGLTPLSPAFIYADTSKGILRFLGGTTGTWPDLPDGSTFFTLRFEVKTPGAPSPITFLPPFDAVNQAFESVLVQTQDGGFKSTVDVNGPTFLNCPGDTILMSNTTDCKAIINYLLQAEDDCSGVASIVSPNHPQNVFDAGETQVSYVAVDSVGNTTVCNFNVTVETQSNIKLLNCPPNLVQGYVTDTECAVPVLWQVPDITGACDFAHVQISVNANPGDTFKVNEPVLVVFVATDTLNGTFDLCSWTVVVLDTIAPKLTCPKDTMLLPNTTGCAAIVDGLLPVASDNCDNDLEVGSTATLPKDTFQIGTTTVQVIASDDSGNFTFCEFKVKVIDNEAPFFVCPKDTQFVTNAGACVATAGWLTPQAFDNCDTTVLTATPNIPPGTDLPLGVTVVEYSSTDAQGNKTTCSFTVTVTDQELPTITCPGDILVNLPLTKCDTILNWAPAFPTDNCGIKSFGVDVPPGSVFAAKTTLVTYTVEDNSNNTATCTFSVTVKDGVRPDITGCPKDTVVTSTDPCGSPVSWTLPTATDNCTPEADLVWSASHMPGDTFPIATTSVLITVADGSGNLDTCKFDVQVLSGVVPGFDQFPVNQTLVGCEAIATWDSVTVKGFCDLPAITSTHVPGDTFPAGVTVVTYTATDINGTTYTATFTVTVTEMTPPVLTGCPPDSIAVNTAGTVLFGASPFLTSVGADPNCAGAVLNFNLPLVTDNCGIALVEQTTGAAPGTLVPVGNTVLTFKGTDNAGNTAQCSVKVTIVGVALPEVMVDARLACPNDSLQIVAMPVIPGATYTWTGPAGAGALPNKSSITIQDMNLNKVGVYKVVVSLGACATMSDSTTVALAQKPDAVDDFTLTIDPSKTDTFDVLANDIYNPADYKVTLLTPQTGLSQQSAGSGNFIYTSGQVSGKVPFMYRVCSVTCPTLCDDATANITIRETDCSFVPNIITPNGDSENDVLVIPCLANSTLFRSNSIVIYNQWGDKVYEAAPYLNNWGGTLDNEPGKDLPDGTYFFIFRPGPNEAVVKGFVEIYR